MGNEMFRDAYIYAQMREGKIPDVYVQNHEYFEKYKDEIKQRYSENIGYLPYVAMHVRRGKNPIDPDEPAYSENPFYVDLTKTKYYADAIDHFPQRKFLIFSDDLPFCRENFKGEIFGFDESENDLESFNKFASCTDHIIANGSWGWWGEYLSPKGGKVIAPSVKNWYSDGVERTICPKEWIRI